MSYYGAVNYLYGLQKYGIKLGLEKTGTILSQLGDPQKDFRSVHIAGTNGKGSVSAMTASILMAHGFRVGLFTSPHLVSFTERIRINNEQISESEVVSLTEEIRLKVESLKLKVKNSTFNLQPSTFNIFEPTFFEFVTAMAFLYFSRNSVDWAVIETGMGGRLDATNLVVPEVSVITKISYDHREFLGETLTDIAREKAGIIKRGIPVISAGQEREAEEVILTATGENSSPLFIYGRDFDGTLKSCDLNGITFDYYASELIIRGQSLSEKGTVPLTDFELTNLFVPLAGEHQLFNACMAIKTAIVALQSAEDQKSRRAEEKNFHSVTSALPLFRASALKDGLANTEWHGRLETISDNPMIMIDGAHNPDAAKALSEFIRKHLNDYRIILIMGIMSDKDISGIMSPLLPLASEIIFTAPNYGRAASPQRLAEYASSIGFDSSTTNSVKEAVEMAIKCCETETRRHGDTEKKRSNDVPDSPIHRFTDSIILITGSFYTIGEAKELLGEKAVLGSLRETL